MTVARTMLLLHFDEPISSALPSDSMGQLEPLGALGDLEMPELCDAFTGRGRAFVAADSNGLTALDAAEGDTCSTRDVTIRAFVSIAEGDDTYPRAIIYRGDGNSGADRYCYGLEITKLALPATPVTLELRLAWQEVDGGITDHAGGTFEWTPAATVDGGAFLYLVATRRWVSTTEVVCRYYVNGRKIGEFTETDGDIGGGTTGATTIGYRWNTDTNDRFWEGVIDEVQVDNFEASAEEIREEWERLTQHQPNGIAALSATVPPGSTWANRGTYWRKMLRVAGQAVGFGLAKISEWRNTWLPDRSYAAKIADWERLHGISPGPLDSLDARRDRVVRYMQRDNGYTISKLLDVLKEPLAVPDPDADNDADLDPALQVLTFSNTIRDSFTTLSTERWLVGDANGAATVGISAGTLRFEMPSGELARWGGGAHERLHCLAALSSGNPVDEGTGRLVMQGKVTSHADVPASLIAGVCMFNRRSKRLLVWGVYNDAGTKKLGYRYYSGTALGAFVSVLNPAPAAPFWLRMLGVELSATLQPPGAGFTSPRWTLGYNTTGPDDTYTEVHVDGIMADPEWAGFWCHSPVVTAADLDVAFDDAVIITPAGTRPFCWYVLRDPDEAGSPNFQLANAMIRSGLRPAHTHGAAIDSRSLLCDTEGHGCDLGPMGAL